MNAFGRDCAQLTEVGATDALWNAAAPISESYRREPLEAPRAGQYECRLNAEDLGSCRGPVRPDFAAQHLALTFTPERARS